MLNNVQPRFKRHFFKNFIFSVNSLSKTDFVIKLLVPFSYASISIGDTVLNEAKRSELISTTDIAVLAGTGILFFACFINIFMKNLALVYLGVSGAYSKPTLRKILIISLEERIGSLGIK
jgi:hypothetical protein